MTAQLRQVGEAALAGATIRRARWNPGGRVLELQLRCHDPARGPLEVLLRYRGVQLLEPALPELAVLCEEIGLSVVSSEVSATSMPPEHRLGLGARGAIVVRFGAVELSETLGNAVEYWDAGPRFQVLSC